MPALGESLRTSSGNRPSRLKCVLTGVRYGRFHWILEIAPTGCFDRFLRCHPEVDDMGNQLEIVCTCVSAPGVPQMRKGWLSFVTITGFMV